MFIGPGLAVRQLLYLPSAAYTAVLPAICTFPTAGVTAAAVDIAVTGFAGGTAPSVTFQLARLAADGNYYGIFAPAGSNISGNQPLTFSAAGQASMDVGIYAQDNTAKPNATDFLGSAHNVFTSMAQLSWSFTGAPTSVTFSVSIVGR